MKFHGLNSDSMSSTHPICNTSSNTQEAQANFDGISYGKGSQVLKQLYFILGHEVMSRGLQIYFDKHSWGNTILSDFVGALEKSLIESGKTPMGEGFNLPDWCDTMLKSSGSNILEPVMEFENGQLKSLKIRQTCANRG